MDLSLKSFQIFGILDDFAMATCCPGDSATRRKHYVHDVQRAFYSGYFRKHGLKAQCVFLPNGMFGSVYIASMAHNDVGTLNMSGIDEQLQDLLQGQLIGNLYPALYVDGIFNVRNTVVPRFKGAQLTAHMNLFNKRMSGVRVSIEHDFGAHASLFSIFKMIRGGYSNQIGWMFVFWNFFWFLGD